MLKFIYNLLTTPGGHCEGRMTELAYVEKNHRNKKIAQRLINTIIEYAKLNTLCRGVMLETQTCNYPAIQLYSYTKKWGSLYQI